jgi:predicted DNA-binding transcriptional regulator AlpA
MATATTKIVRMETDAKRVSVDSSRLLTPLQTSEFLGVPLGTLAQWRSQGRGPQYVKLEGRLVRYRTSDLERYISSRMVETEVPLAIR